MPQDFLAQLHRLVPIERPDGWLALTRDDGGKAEDDKPGRDAVRWDHPDLNVARRRGHARHLHRGCRFRRYGLPAASPRVSPSSASVCDRLRRL